MRSRIALPVLPNAFPGGCVNQGSQDKGVQQADGLPTQKRTYQVLNAQLQSAIQADRVRVRQLENRPANTLIDKIVFNSGSVEMNAKGRRENRRIDVALTDLKL